MHYSAFDIDVNYGQVLMRMGTRTLPSSDRASQTTPKGRSGDREPWPERAADSQRLWYRRCFLGTSERMFVLYIFSTYYELKTIMHFCLLYHLGVLISRTTFSISYNAKVKLFKHFVYQIICRISFSQIKSAVILNSLIQKTPFALNCDWLHTWPKA